MTKEAAIKHKNAISWFLENTEKGLWIKYRGVGTWQLSQTPDFDIAHDIVQNDDYAYFRKQSEDGKELQYLTGLDNKWNDIKNKDISPQDLVFNSGVSSYRIKPEEPKTEKQWKWRYLENYECVETEAFYSENKADDEWIKLPWTEIEVEL